jgi:hypothetical protein
MIRTDTMARANCGIAALPARSVARVSSLRRSSARHRRIPCRSTYGLSGIAAGKTHVLPTQEGAISRGQAHSPNAIPLVASS